MSQPNSTCSVGLAAVLMAAMLAPGVALAQATFTGAQLRGTVLDATGAAVPDATVTIKNEETQISQSERTDNVGRYTFNILPPGSYTIRVEKTGFQAAQSQNVTLRVNQQANLDFNLALGQTSTVLEVKGSRSY